MKKKNWLSKALNCGLLILSSQNNSRAVTCPRLYAFAFPSVGKCYTYYLYILVNIKI